MCSCHARNRWVSICKMKRDATLAHSPLNLAMVVHVRLSPADTAQPDLSAPNPRLSQVTTLAASTPVDPDLIETQEQPLAICWLVGSSTDLPPPAGTPPDGGPAERQSPFSALSGPYRGCPPPLPVSEPAPVQVVNSDIFARALGCREVSSCSPGRVRPQSATPELGLRTVP